MLYACIAIALEPKVVSCCVSPPMKRNVGLGDMLMLMIVSQCVWQLATAFPHGRWQVLTSDLERCSNPSKRSPQVTFAKSWLWRPNSKLRTFKISNLEFSIIYWHRRKQHINMCVSSMTCLQVCFLLRAQHSNRANETFQLLLNSGQFSSWFTSRAPSLVEADDLFWSQTMHMPKVVVSFSLKKIIDFQDDYYS